MPVFTDMTETMVTVVLYKQHHHLNIVYESGNPAFNSCCSWMPVFTGMTRLGVAGVLCKQCPFLHVNPPKTGTQSCMSKYSPYKAVFFYNSVTIYLFRLHTLNPVKKTIILYSLSRKARSLKKILITGGVAGGASFAARMRRLDETAEIIMFERGDFISFCKLRPSIPHRRNNQESPEPYHSNS